MKILGSLFIVGSMFLACSGGSDSYKYESDSEEYATNELVIESSKTSSRENSTTEIEAKIIKESNLRFETSSLEKTHQSIINLLKANKGFIQKDETSKNYGNVERSLVIRIPTKGFQNVIDTLTKQVKVFDRKEISQRDVTEEFIDLEARLKAKLKLEARYLELLAKAKNVKEILEIEREIAKIREEIEAKQGRLKYLKNKVSLSTIYISFYETVEFQKAESKTYLSRVVKALKGGFTGIGNFIIGILYLWPFIIIGILVFLFIRSRMKNSSQTKK
jgi:hypothetical protein